MSWAWRSLRSGHLISSEKYNYLMAHCLSQEIAQTGADLLIVEALWVGSAVVAHDNPSNWHTTGEEQIYFSNGPSCESAIEAVMSYDARVERARRAARIRAA